MMNFLTPNVSNIQNPEELQANQRGEITEAQNSRLNASVGFQNGCGVLIFALFLIPFLCSFSFIFSELFSSWPVGLLIVGILLLLIVALILRSAGVLGIWNRWNALKRDRENRAVRQGQGQLAFEKGKYIVQAAGQALLLPASNNACGLMPGATYRFYYLEESGFVLSAEELFPASPAQARNSLLEILTSANKFSMEDLQLNSTGEVTSAQRMRALPQMLMGLLFGLVPLGFGLFLLLNTSRQSDDLAATLIPLIFLAIFGLVGGYLFLNSMLDLMATSPMVTEGAGHKEKRTSGGKNRRTVYYYVIEGVSFQVSQAAYQALVDGERYRVYALPRTKRLLTIEPL
jgi:hypothetical protein